MAGEELPAGVRDALSRLGRFGHLEVNSSPADSPSAPEKLAQQGRKPAELSIDGRVFSLDTPGLSPEMREILRYIEAHGPTPALMEQLGRFGDQVEVRSLLASATSPRTGADIPRRRQSSLAAGASQERRRAESADLDRDDWLFKGTVAVCAFGLIFFYFAGVHRQIHIQGYLRFLFVLALAVYLVPWTYARRERARLEKLQSEAQDPKALAEATRRFQKAERIVQWAARVIGGGDTGPIMLLLLAILFFVIFRW